jgi:hypothetical protein
VDFGDVLLHRRTGLAIPVSKNTGSGPHQFACQRYRRFHPFSAWVSNPGKKHLLMRVRRGLARFTPFLLFNVLISKGHLLMMMTSARFTPIK